MRASDISFEPFVGKMAEAGCSPAEIAHFERNYRRYASGEGAHIPESHIEPVSELTRLEDLSSSDRVPWSQVVVIKLNGGLGTSMGLDKPKGLLPVKQGLTFVDIVARQILHLRESTGAVVPLVLMNSFNTSSSTLEALSPYSLDQPVPLEFLQSKVPKISLDLEPASHPEAPHYEWCPPGHGDIYPSLRNSGILEQLLAAGVRYAFISNIDNLGAVLDPAILTWFAAENLPFLMEVTERTPGDRKGGHLARDREGGHLLLREIAQCPDEDTDHFQDIDRHRFFNTNNLWVNLEALSRREHIDLPLIVNRKKVRPDDPGSQDVIQLETAMGAAISALEGSAALHVPRTRFAPVKTTSELLGVRSDAYRLDESFRLTLVPGRQAPPVIELDSTHYKMVPDFESHFPAGPPSLVECDWLAIEGSVRFGSGVVVRGECRLINESGQTVALEDGAVLEGERRLG